MKVVVMKKNISPHEVVEYIREARKDPEFRRDLKKFIAMHTGKKSK